MTKLLLSVKEVNHHLNRIVSQKAVVLSGR